MTKEIRMIDRLLGVQDMSFMEWLGKAISIHYVRIFMISNANLIRNVYGFEFFK